MQSAITLQTIFVAGTDQVACSLGEEIAILHMRSGVYYGLDPVGARVWSLLQQPRPATEILATLLAEYQVEPSRCEVDLLDLLRKLHLEGLIEVRDGAAA